MGEPNTQYKKSTIVLVLVMLALLTGGTAGALHALNHQQPSPDVAVAPTPNPQVEGATIIHLTAQPGKTVLEQLQNTEKVIVDPDPADGGIVESINGVKNGVDNKYWSFYVNGQITNIGAGNYTTKGGEDITWKFE